VKTTKQLTIIAQKLIEIKEKIILLENEKKETTEKLVKLYLRGEIPKNFVINNAMFSYRNGFTKYTFNKTGNAMIHDLKTKLINEGMAELKRGSPFWMIQKTTIKEDE
jgi:hypothetical protein